MLSHWALLRSKDLASNVMFADIVAGTLAICMDITIAILLVIIAGCEETELGRLTGGIFRTRLGARSSPSDPPPFAVEALRLWSMIEECRMHQVSLTLLSS
jgi:hypothetical protein